jgi:hypothetical protein
MQHYHLASRDQFGSPSKPDISPDQRWRIPMNILIRAAFAALSLATITPVANAATANNTPAFVQQVNQIAPPGPGWG